MISQNKTRGFTLIELMVVVAIIGILSSIVLLAVNTVRAKAQDTKVKSEMSGLRSAAEIFYDGVAGYNLFFTSNDTCDSGDTEARTYIASIVAANGIAGEDCGSETEAWAMATTLPSGSFWCTDSTGVSRGETSAGVPYSGLYGSGNEAKDAANATLCR